MVDILLDMLCVLAIIVVGVLILAVVAATIYAILYFVYKTFIENDEDKHGGQ